VLRQGDDAVEVLLQAGGVGVEDLERGAGAGDLVEEDFPLAAGEVGGAFEAILAAGHRGEAEMCSIGSLVLIGLAADLGIDHRAGALHTADPPAGRTLHGQ